MNTVHPLGRAGFLIYCPRHITHLFTDATSSLPIYSVRAFSDETPSLPTDSMRALFWQIENQCVLYILTVSTLLHFTLYTRGL